jgi:hypothetical protein
MRSLKEEQLVLSFVVPRDEYEALKTKALIVVDLLTYELDKASDGKFLTSTTRSRELIAMAREFLKSLE